MNKKGFTLTEILVVLIVAGVLLALILPNALKSVDKAEDVANLSDLNTINSALMVCYADTRDWADCDAADGSELVAGNYLSAMPTHPNFIYTVVADPNTNGFIAQATAR